MKLPAWAARALRRLGGGFETLGGLLRRAAGEVERPVATAAEEPGELPWETFADAGPPEHWLARVRQATSRVGARVARERTSGPTVRGVSLASADRAAEAGAAAEPARTPAPHGFAAGPPATALRRPAGPTQPGRSAEGTTRGAEPAPERPSPGPTPPPPPSRDATPAAPRAAAAMQAPPSGAALRGRPGRAETTAPAAPPRSPAAQDAPPMPRPRPSPIARPRPGTRAAATSAATPYTPPPELRPSTGQIRDDGAGGAVSRPAVGPHWTSAAPEVRESRAERPEEDADEAGDELWPELPEWVRPSCQHDLMTLLLQEDRRRRLVAEQTASSWSAPPF